MNKKKNDLKKLALMGLTGGLLFSAPGLVALEESEKGNLDSDFFTSNTTKYSSHFAGGSCGSSGHGCQGAEAPSKSTPSVEKPSSGNSKGNNSMSQAPRNNDSGYYSHNQGQGCGGQRPSQGQNNYAADEGQKSEEHNMPLQTPKKPNIPQKSGGYYAANDGMGDGKERMEQEANKMNPQSPKPMAPRGNYIAENDHKPAAKKGPMTEKDLMEHLNAQGKAAYQALTPEGKVLAMKLANQECKGHNDCKGLNSCKGPENACAGKGGCKGRAMSKFDDMNLAVKVAAAKMAEKRNGAMHNQAPAR